MGVGSTSSKLIVSVAASTLEAMRSTAFKALDRGADLVELRLDFLAEATGQGIRALVSELGPRCIITLRPFDEGGHYDGPEADRLALLIEASRGGPLLTDIEYSHYRSSANIRQKARLAAGTNGLILSVHDFAGRPATLSRTMEDMVAESDCGVAKAAWKARRITDNFEAFELLRSVPKPTMALCMGEAGLLSRVLAGKYGAFGTYCSPEQGSESAPGQLTLERLRESYRWDHINADTEVYGVVGSPVAHSMSPAIFNAAFESTGLNAVYLPMLVHPSEDEFRDFMWELLARPWLGFRGLSVTLPHKVHAFRLCRRALDDVSRRSGAVNTLTVMGDQVSGTNTDAKAAVQALTDGLGCENEDLKGLQVDVLGAGGVARAVVAALSERGCRLTIYNRTFRRAAELAETFDCSAKPWEERTRRAGRLLINCTRVGMWPDAEHSPMPVEGLEMGGTVFDTVYNPPVTRLLSDARQRGCDTISGVEMFVRQAATQFELWTGRDAPRELMDGMIRARLRPSSGGAKP
jgi:3-dehydroquinate dehydratase/shikimate dehydrogenase